MRHDDRMNETEGKALAQGQGMNVPGETETREEAEMSREKGQDAEEKKAAPEAPQEDAAFDRQLEEMMNGTGGKKAGKKKRGKKKFLLAAAVLAVLGIGAVKVLGGSEPSLPTAATVTPVRKGIQNRLSVSGPVSGTDSVDVVSNLHAEVLEIPVKEGDKVTKGQVLAVLDDTDLRKEVAMAKNDYDLAVSTCAEQDRDARNGYAKAVQDLKTAQDNYNRTKVLYDSGDVPLVDLETAENGLNDAKRQAASYEVKNGQAVAGDSYRLQVEKARFEYEKKQEQLADTQITSPIDGTVVRVNTKVGRFADSVEDSEPLFIIENLDVLEMEIKVSEYSIGKVAVGQEAEISADILDGETVRGQVVSISPTGEEKGGGSTERVIPTKVRIMDENTKLIAGITAKAQIVLEEKEDALTVPVAAVTERNGVSMVLAVKDGMIHEVPVQTGIEGDVELEILPGEGEELDETTQIVAAPSEGLTEGMAVTAMAQ